MSCTERTFSFRLKGETDDNWFTASLLYDDDDEDHPEHRFIENVLNVHLKHYMRQLLDKEDTNIIVEIKEGDKTSTSEIKTMKVSCYIDIITELM